MTCGLVQIFTTSPHTAYRAELQTFAIKIALVTQEEELACDNKVVVNHALEPPHRECSNMELRLKVQEETHHNTITQYYV